MVNASQKRLTMLARLVVGRRKENPTKQDETGKNENAQKKNFEFLNFAAQK